MFYKHEKSDASWPPFLMNIPGERTGSPQPGKDHTVGLVSSVGPSGSAVGFSVMISPELFRFLL